MSVGSTRRRDRRPKKRHHNRGENVRQLNVTLDEQLVDRLIDASNILAVNQWEIVETALRAVLPDFEAQFPADALEPDPALFTSNLADSDRNAKGRSAASDAA